MWNRFLFKRGAGPQRIALYTKMLEQTLWYLKMPPEFIDIIGLLVGFLPTLGRYGITLSFANFR